jgi:adenylate cyclase
MAEKKIWARVLETKYFGLIIGLLIFLAAFAVSTWTVLIKNIELKTLDFNFRMKNIFTATRLQEGVSQVEQNINISPDILLVAIDDKSLDRFGKWPFPRYREADLIDNFTRIKDQGQRERALFLDIFFTEPDRIAEDDARLVDSIRENGRVFLETVLTESANTAGTEDEYFGRQDILYSRIGSISHIVGDWTKVSNFKGLEPSLKPYARAVYGYGHANFLEDGDKVYRRQPLVVKVERLQKEIRLEDLATAEPIDRAGYERLAWTDKKGMGHDVAYPLTETVIADLKKQMEKNAPQRAEDTDGDGIPDLYYYVVRKFKDSFMPSITLSLALDYFHKSLDDAEVVLGKYILISAPQKFDVDSQQWEPYKILEKSPKYDQDGIEVEPGVYTQVREIRIPIDETGAMLINFMGDPSSADPQGYQTFPVRPFSGYAGTPPSGDPSTWPRTKAVANTIVMVGPFSQGMAADQKPTPFGLMYGVEIHANALNNILMNNFLHPAEPWVTTLILFVAIMLTAFMVSRLSTIWSLIATAVAMIVYFFCVLLSFEMSCLLTLSTPLAGCFLCFLAVVAYRTMTEEKDKRRIRDMFGKYVSPSVVDQILENPPELGGVDKNLTVFFSDIRGFTTLSERMTPQALVNHLNAYLTAMTDIIMEYQGTLDKYVGDEIMCFWGAPLPQPDHALLACKCALKQIEVLNQLNSQWPPEKRLAIGIGLNSGIMTVGNMGSLGRMNYTLMGDNVNLGARLEGTNKTYHTTIILSEFTFELVKDSVVARELDVIRVVGKNKPVVIYELLDVLDGLQPQKTLEAKGKTR